MPQGPTRPTSFDGSGGAGATRDTGPVSSPAFGLCAACAHQRVVGNTRGSTFSLCGLSRVDDRFPRYPRMPVGSCPGFRRRDDEPDAAGADAVPPTGADGASAPAGVDAPDPTRQDDR